MKQKFPPGTMIRVSKRMPPNMSHFDKDFIGIVEGSYHDLFGGGDAYKKSYGIIKLSNRGTVVNCISWYPENLLTALSDYERLEFYKDALEKIK